MQTFDRILRKGRNLFLKKTRCGYTTILKRHGKIVENWGEVDNLGLLQQLGVIPTYKQNR